MNRQWKRAAIGVCGVTAIIVGGGAVLAPGAQAATPSDSFVHTSDLLDTVGGTVGGIVGGLVPSTPAPAPSATGGSATPTAVPIVVLAGTVPTAAPTAAPSGPISITTDQGTLQVGVGGATIGVGTGDGSVDVSATAGNGAGIGIQVGGSGSGATVTGAVQAPSLPTPESGVDGATATGGTVVTNPVPAPAQASDPAPIPPARPAVKPNLLTALAVKAPFRTVYPQKDGYRDTVAFQLRGVAEDGQQHATRGQAVLTLGSSRVAAWPITRTDQTIVWNGLKAGKVVAGRYLLRARITDETGTALTAVESVVVSPQRLLATTHTVTSKAVSGTHAMAAKPRSGLSKGRVTMRITASVRGLKGKQYLVFRHGTKKLKVLVRNGKHASASITIPKAFTSYTISHTWKKGVTVRSLQYEYRYKALK